MNSERPYFMFDENAKPAESLAHSLIAVMGQSPLDKADAIISVGGDGMILQSLTAAAPLGIPVYAVTPKESESQGFWADHEVQTAQDLRTHLAQAHETLLLPLKAEVSFQDGSTKTCYAFNDVSVEGSSMQAVLLSLSAVFGKAAAGPFRVMGSGLVFSTAYGSTAKNRSCGGPTVDIRNEVIVMTGNNLIEPCCMKPVVAQGATSVFKAAFVSATAKRPVMVGYDGHTVSQDMKDSPASGVTVSLAAADKSARFLFAYEPEMRALWALTGRA